MAKIHHDSVKKSNQSKKTIHLKIIAIIIVTSMWKVVWNFFKPALNDSTEEAKDKYYPKTVLQKMQKHLRRIHNFLLQIKLSLQLETLSNCNNFTAITILFNNDVLTWDYKTMI